MPGTQIPVKGLLRETSDTQATIVLGGVSKMFSTEDITYDEAEPPVRLSEAGEDRKESTGDRISAVE